MTLWKAGTNRVCPNCPASSTKKRECVSLNLLVQAQVVPAVPCLWVIQRACAQDAWSHAEGGGENVV